MLSGSTRRNTPRFYPAGTPWRALFRFSVPLLTHGPIAMILRVTGGNFRLLHRLLTQIGRVLELNKLTSVTTSVVEAARESLVIGTA